MSSDEGYVKFQCDFRRADLEHAGLVQQLITARQAAHAMGLIGALPDGVGFGNISARTNGDEFIISGTATGGIPLLKPEHFCLVKAAQIESNQVCAEGPCEPSSESMTHAACYLGSHEVLAVLHVHHAALWQSYLNRLPSTDSQAAYGTPHMAQEVLRLVKSDFELKHGVVIMSGHQDGIMLYGSSLEACLRRAAELLRQN